MILHLQAGEILKSAFADANSGAIITAEKSAWRAWNTSRDLPEAAVLAARLALVQRRFDKSDEYLSEIMPQVDVLNKDLAAEALEIHALSNEAQLRFSDSLDSFQRLLNLDPKNLIAHEHLAKMFGASGRREDAIEHILRLVQAGQKTDALMLLTRESGAIRDERLAAAAKSTPTDPFPLVGLANYAHESQDNPTAIGLLQAAIKLREDYVPAHVMMLRILGDSESWDALDDHWNKLAESTRNETLKFATVWTVRGRLAEARQDTLGSIRCYLEACRLQPDSRMPNSRLATLLSQVGESKLANQFADFSRKLQELWSAQDRILFTGTPDKVDQFLTLSSRYEACERFWEAQGWMIWAYQLSPNSPEVQQRLRSLISKTENAPLVLVDYKRHPVAQVDISKFPLPKVGTSTEKESASPSPTPNLELAFEDQSKNVGFNFEFCYGTEGEPKRYMYELSGGGVGVLDFDLDGWPDFVTPQGRMWPASTDQSAERTDRMFRNKDGKQFIPIQLPSQNDGFGQGVACGDFDNDGFPDIYIAQIGSNRLLRNMGDGTFVDVTEQSGLSSDQWTVSCVMADLNGDSHPDIYDVNYLRGDDLFTRICQREGIAAQCSPFEFDGSPDAMWISDGAGGFNKVIELPVGRGLGAVAFDATGNGHTSLFITNDTDPNFLLAAETKEGTTTVTETGITSGVAFNEAGKAEGSMGIALGDVNNDGLMDLFVTNFLNETNTLYQNLGEGAFQDVTKFSGLDGPSLSVLGFGTQFFDANLDGRLELFVANGHVDDLRVLNRPYKMQAHLYTAVEQRFSQLLDAGEYFKRELLGRSVAKVDWNQDFREDLVISHLQSPYALLTNNSKILRHPIAIRLVGRSSNRDAIGSTITMVEGDRRICKQVTAGDGYESSNSKEILFGASDPNAVMFEITWPTGKRQQVQVEFGQRVTIVEPD